MSYLLEDLGGLVGATLLAPMLLCFAGSGLLRLLDRAGLAAAEGFWPRAGWAPRARRWSRPGGCWN